MIDVMLHLIQSLPHTARVFRKGQYIFHQGDAVATMFLIEDGEARLVRRRRDGGAAVLRRAGAATRVKARLIPRASMNHLFEIDMGFAKAWASHLAAEVRKARLRAEILSLKTVAERLDAWLAGRGHIPEKGGWKVIAHEIGASPEALYRELARRRR